LFFYIDGQPENQGSETWQLVKTVDGWRIASITWPRQEHLRHRSHAQTDSFVRTLFAVIAVERSRHPSPGVHALREFC
jgi:hypothetical protein